MEGKKYVSLAGLTVSIEFLEELYENLKNLKFKSALRFWEIVHLARNPNYLLPKQSLKQLFEAGVLGTEDQMYYVSRIAILHLVEGQDRKLDVITEKQFEKLISP